MNELFWYIVSFQAFSCVLTALLLVYRYYLGNRLIAQTNKLKSQMANIRQQFPEFEEKRSQIVAQGLGDIGIEGIMQELGIDPGILKNPLVKGLIEKYAPRVLESMSKNGGKSKTQETDLL